LAKEGFLRASGKPWVWDDLATGLRKCAENRLHEIFHNPFYAGWVVSERFGIGIGEITGKWEPIVTTEEFNRGLEILSEHDSEKSRHKKHFYLLRKLLWVEENGKCYPMYVSTPSGYSRSYSYYITHSKPNGKKIHIPCESVDAQIQDLLDGITVTPLLVPSIRKIYHSQIKQSTEDDRENKLSEFKRQMSRLKEEEARLGRLVITEKITEGTYDQLRKEWKEKQRNIEANIADLERETTIHLDDLDVALILITKLSFLYPRLNEKDRAILLQVLVKRIIVDPQGEIIDHELNSPFAYLRNIVNEFQLLDSEARSSEYNRLGAPYQLDNKHS